MKKGFTVVEVTVVLMLLAIGIAAVWGLLNLSYSTNMREAVLMELVPIRNVMDRIVREVRASAPGTMTITKIGTGEDNYKISFDTPTAVGIQYYRNNGNQVIREYPAGETRIIANNIASLKFTRTDKLLTIEIRAEKPLLGNTNTFSLTEKVRLRNG